MRRVYWSIVLAVWLAGCGGGSPTGPSGSSESFQGTWTGNWRTQSCSETGGAVGTGCAGLPQSGYLRAALTQAGTSVEGTVEIEVFLTRVTGQVSGDGVLTLTGTGRLLTVRIDVSDWRTTQSGNALAGTFTFTVVPDDPAAGTTTVRASLEGVTRAP